MQPVFSHWREIMQRRNVPKARHHEWWLRLSAAYSEPQRFYHTLTHIENCVDRYLYTAPQDQAQDATMMALFFHDSVYITENHNNEEQSADFCAQCMSDLQFPISEIESAQTLILSTKTHTPVASGVLKVESELLLDADLSILGANAADYQQYARQIRQEYSWVPEQTYREKRSEILQRFLQRARIFFVDSVRQALELQARKNLENEIRDLATAG